MSIVFPCARIFIPASFFAHISCKYLALPVVFWAWEARSSAVAPQQRPENQRYESDEIIVKNLRWYAPESDFTTMSLVSGQYIRIFSIDSFYLFRLFRLVLMRNSPPFLFFPLRSLCQDCFISSISSHRLWASKILE